MAGALVVCVAGSVPWSASAHLFARQPRNAFAAVSGTVVDGVTRAPLAGALVTLASAGYRGRVLTDTRGRFVFVHLTNSGRFAVSATKVGYFDGALGRDVASGAAAAPVLAFSGGEWLQDVVITLWKPVAISGRVVDHRGRPAIGAALHARRVTTIGGVTTFLDGDRAYAGETDDRGIYRIAGLTRGRYVVGVIGRSVEAPTAEGVRQVYPTVYYPQSPAAGTSTPVVVESGGDVTNIDLSLPQPKRAAGLRGHVVPPGASAHVALNGLLVKLMAADAMDDGEEPIATVAADAAGAFVFDRLAEGDYVIDVAVAFPTRTVSRPSGIPQVARPSSQPRRPLRNVVLAFGSDGVTSTFVEPQATAGSGYWARQRVSVSAASRDDVAVMLNEGATVAGRVDYDSEHARAAFLRHPLPAVALEPDGLLAAVDAETGVFAVDGVRPGIHRLRVLQPGVAIMAVAGHAPDDPDAAIDTRGGRDVDVSVTVTDRLAVVSGLVKAPLAQLEAGATVVYTRADAAWAGHQQIGRIPVDTRGVYTASREPLVAGRYHFLALPSRDVAQWTNDGLLDETLTKRGTIVTIGWGEQRMINLDLTSLAPSQ